MGYFIDEYLINSSFKDRVLDELKSALLRQQPDAALADEVKYLRAEVKRKIDIIHGLTAEKNMYTSEMSTMRVTQEVTSPRYMFK